MTTRHTGPGPTRQHIRTAKTEPRVQVVERHVPERLVVWPAVPAAVLLAALIEGVIHLL